jgi:hypothetical protein
LYALAIVFVVGAVYVTFFNNPNSASSSKKYTATEPLKKSSNPTAAHEDTVSQEE